MDNRVILDDCMEGMRGYPDNYFDLAVVDPPYGIGVGKMPYLSEVGNMVTQRNGVKLSANVNKRVYSKKDWDSSTPSYEWYKELDRVSKNYIIFGIEYMEWKDYVGKGRIVWDKGVPEGVSFGRYETACCSLIDCVVEIPLLWAGMNQAKSITEPMVMQGNKSLNEKRIHPCHKPIMLYDIIFKNYAQPGMKILDTHVGSGSSRIAADKAGLDFTGYEIDAEYWNLQEKRFLDYKKQLKLF